MIATRAAAQQPELHTGTELDSLLQDRAGIGITMPELGYLWSGSDISGSDKEGSIWVLHRKMIYYLIHWGPIETDEITPEYVRERIPKIWPSEGIEVRNTRAMTVAGHPAIYAEAVAASQFYSPQYLIWNCPESGRQFIADMNYNTLYRTPVTELQAQIDATTSTLACHTGAPSSPVPGHVVRYDNPRFRLAFSHPLRWYVFESPFGVPHPSYRGVRNDTIGSVLAWPEDRRVRLGFIWGPKPETEAVETSAMVGDVQAFRAVVDLMQRLESVESFTPEASEMLNVRGWRVLKVLGRVSQAEPEDPPTDFEAEGRAAVLLVDAENSERRLFIVLWIDNYTLEGRSLPPARDIFDRWALDLLGSLSQL
ncbi:MAG: hypothetical protein PVJ64_11125 [Gemmatimonadales bacterium]